MASYVCGTPKTLREVARLANVGEDRMRALYGELYAAQEGLGSRDWRDVFGEEVRKGVVFPPL